MEFLTNNLAATLVGLGLLLLAIEVGALGLSVMVLLFIGLACVVSGLLMWLGLLSATWVAACGGVAVLSFGFAVALWKPLQKLQRGSGATEVKGDFIGHRFVLEQEVSNTRHGHHRLSGVDWKVRGDGALNAGTSVEVVKVEVGMLSVAPVRVTEA
jgi:membrane protein implicated in regulation of membrane protease activity